MIKPMTTGGGEIVNGSKPRYTSDSHFDPYSNRNQAFGIKKPEERPGEREDKMRLKV